MKTVILLIFIIAIVLISYFISQGSRKPQCYGLYMGQDISSDQIEKISKRYGEKPCIILTFVGWSDRPFKSMLSTLNSIKKAGAIPMITLEPWLFPSKQPISIENISKNKEEKTLREFATILQQYDSPIFLRFAHEMNGNWYPWSGYQNKKQTKTYINAWRKVHETLTKYSGNTKISWVWSINAEDLPLEKWNEPKNYYPGDEYVNIIGIDGYNFKKRSFESIFKKQIEYLRNNFKEKTIFITETASSNAEVNRAKWIKDFFYKFSRKYSYIPIFIWFDINKEKNWNLCSDQTSVDAFNSGLKRLIPKEPRTLLEEEKK